MHPVPYANAPDKAYLERKNAKGDILIKYTCGVSLFYLPFFLVANAYTHITHHYDTLGFSLPYSYAIMIAGVFWAFMGLYFLKNLLLRYFSRIVMWSALLCVLLGTNMFHYVTKFMGMSHVFSFALIAGLLLLIDTYYKRPTTGRAIFMAFLIGWLVLVRPTNCVFVLFLLLFKVTNLTGFNERLAFLRGRIADIFIALPFAVITWIPQLMYWKKVFGTWVSYSYQDEHFIYWNHPKILRVLFDTQNGLFLYSPTLILMFVAFVVARRDKRTGFIGTSLVFAIITYIFASWWMWFFGGAYGHRCYIEYMPVFALPMAVALEKIIAMKRQYIKIPVILVILLMSYYSIGMSRLYNSGAWDGPAWEWNLHTWYSQARQLF
jgi:hypothetical protein